MYNIHCVLYPLFIIQYITKYNYIFLRNLLVYFPKVFLSKQTGKLENKCNVLSSLFCMTLRDSALLVWYISFYFSIFIKRFQLHISFLEAAKSQHLKITLIYQIQCS